MSPLSNELLNPADGASEAHESVSPPSTGVAGRAKNSHRLTVLANEYFCPGELHPISHSIHVARLASHYSKCRDCSHRVMADPASSRSTIPETPTTDRPARTSLIATDGVRGIYLNEIDRRRAIEWGAALASMLWDEAPRVGTSSRDQEPGSSATPQSEFLTVDQKSADQATMLAMDSANQASARAVKFARRGPTVVIGFDERSSSPDIVTGVALGLRRMGCQVIDLGQTTIPCFQFAVRHLEASAGMCITGAGCDPAWTGFDIVGRDGQPWSRGPRLSELESRVRAGVMRPTRTAGSQRTFQALVPYEAGLLKHFHALRPLHVGCGSSTKLGPRIIDRLFSRLPCQVTHVALPVRQRDLSDERDADVQRIASAVTATGCHLGMIIDDDGQRCAFVTERGRLVTLGEVARVLIELERKEHHHTRIVSAASLAGELTEWGRPLGLEVVSGGTTAEAVSIAVSADKARIGLMDDGRIWFGESHPECDALITLARLLQALSLSDASFEEVLARQRRTSVHPAAA